MDQPQSIFIDLGGKRRRVVLWGNPAHPPLILIHGLRDHARSWDWTAQHFCDRYHVVVPDLRGHGDSDWTEADAYRLSNYVKDIAAIIDALGIAVFDLVGHSLGGQLSLRLAATYPEKLRSLCLIEGVELPIVRDQRREAVPYPVRLRRWIEKGEARATPRFFASLAEAQARMATRNPAIDAETIAHLARHGTIAVGRAGFRWKFDPACAHRAPSDAHGVDLDEMLDAIACPTLLAYGLESWIPVPPPERLRRLRHHRVVTFPGVSHWLHHQARSPFLSTLSGFLEAPVNSLMNESICHA